MSKPKIVLTPDENGKYIVLKGRDILERAMAAAEKASTTGERVPLEAAELVVVPAVSRTAKTIIH
jgi:hypothetical protein